DLLVPLEEFGRLGPARRYRCLELGERQRSRRRTSREHAQQQPQDHQPPKDVDQRTAEDAANRGLLDLRTGSLRLALTGPPLPSSGAADRSTEARKGPPHGYETASR